MVFNLKKFLLEDDDDDDNNLLLEEPDGGSLLIILAYYEYKATRRSTCYTRSRIKWDRHVKELKAESPQAFDNMYRMSVESFNKLCCWIDPFVRVNPVKSRNRTGKQKISTEIVLHCLLRWLAGGSHSDIRVSAGISKPAFYTCVSKGFNAILRCNQLTITFPETTEQFEESAREFQALSTGGVVDGCVACIDGMLLSVQTPSTDETGNVNSYYSGHYSQNGINIQAACDSFSRFVYVALAAPGGTSDVVALRKTSMAKKIESLPLGKYVIGDNAYVCTEHLLTPFPGEQRRFPKNDTYNFHLSQLRIRIEMTFGRFTNRWRLFRRPLQLKLQNVGKVFMCAARLHNFCEDERRGLPAGAAAPEDGEVLVLPLPSDEAEQVVGNSMMRDILVDQVYHSGQSRPSNNRGRNGRNVN
jgi:hypothetical protein